MCTVANVPCDKWLGNRNRHNTAVVCLRVRLKVAELVKSHTGLPLSLSVGYMLESVNTIDRGIACARAIRLSYIRGCTLFALVQDARGLPRKRRRLLYQSLWELLIKVRIKSELLIAYRYLTHIPPQFSGCLNWVHTA